MKYELMAETQCPHYPDGEPSDIAVVTQHGPTWYWTRWGALRAKDAILSDGCVGFRWSIFRARLFRNDRFVAGGDSWNTKPPR